MSEQIPLNQAFAARPNRFRLLEKGIVRMDSDGNDHKFLEVGCSQGDAAAYAARKDGYTVTAIDIDDQLIALSKEKHRQEIVGGSLTFACADAGAMPFEEESFDGIYSEAAFSPLSKKEQVIKEYYRVLKRDGRILLNDFVIKSNMNELQREEVVHIPCFAGVQTRECYMGLMEKAGFCCIYYKEEYGELIGITSWLCKTYHIQPGEIGGYLSKYFHNGGASKCVAYGGKPDGEFFRKSQLTYCQMIFKKI